MLSSLVTQIFHGAFCFLIFYDKAASKLAEEYLFSQPLATTCQYEALAGASRRSKVKLLTHGAHFQNMNYHSGDK